MSKKGVTLTAGSDTLYTKPYYPVGSIIYNSNANYNPNGDLIGTWQQIKDVFLLACGTTYKNGAIGGEAKHKLTVSEMPSHSHELYGCLDGVDHNVTNTGNEWAQFSTSWTRTEYIKAAGGGQAHNNMPPYRAVYVWERIS